MLKWVRQHLRYGLTSKRIDRELAQELEFHRDMIARDEERRGHSRSTALVNATRRMGNTTLMTEYSREAWIIGWLDARARRSLRAAIVRPQPRIHHRRAGDDGARHRCQHGDLPAG